MVEKKLAPELRFPEFQGIWEHHKLFEVTKKIQDGTHFSPPINQEKDYKYITSKNIRPGLLDLTDIDYISKEEHKKIYQRCDVKLGDVLLTKDGASTGNACINTLAEEFSLLSSVAFIRADNHSATNEFIFQLISSPIGQKEIQKSISGQAITRITLSKLRNYKFSYPKSIAEQQKIAAFLSATDERIQLLERKKLALGRYKKAMIQKIFNREIRFKDNNGKDFPDWEQRQMKDVLFEHKKKNSTNQISEVFSVAKEKGVINQIEHLGRSYSAESISHYKIAEPFDLVYTKSPTSGYPFGIIKQNLTGRIGVLSPLYAVFKPQTRELGTILHNYFLSSTNTYNYLVPLVQKGAKNTMNINNDDFLNGARILLPISHLEQQKIASFLSTIDDLIAQVGSLLARAKEYKKGLLQKMFV